MTNAKKVKNIYRVAGPEVYDEIIRLNGPGVVYLPKNPVPASERNLQIKADYYAKLADLPPKEAIKQLAKEYDLSPDRIRKIINTSGSG